MSAEEFDDTPDVPWDKGTEQAILGALMLDAGAWDRVADVLLPVSFFDVRHAAAFSAIGMLANACKPVDVFTVHDQLQAITPKDAEVRPMTLAELNHCTSIVAGGMHVRRYAEIVARHADERAVRETADQLVEVSRRQGPLDARIDTMLGRVAALQERATSRQGPELMGDLLPAQMDRYSDLAQGLIPVGRSTGLKDIDRVLNGGLHEGRVVCIAARPSIGKTSLAMSIALHRAKAGDGVLFWSGEMPKGEVVDRGVCNLGGIDYGRLQRGELNEFEWGSLTEAADTIRGLPLWIDDEAGVSLAGLRGKAMKLRKHGLKLIVVDYVQLMAGEGIKGQSRSQEIEVITRGIKALAKQLKATVILLSQLNREVEKRTDPTPTMADLRDSGGIEQDADVVLLLWLCRRMSSFKVVGCFVGKHRQGENGGRIPLEFHGQFQRWHDSTADLSPPAKVPKGLPSGID